mmetsp:Transcript_21471/g.29506  ORF Transcript_21471/g.29506 Transcript_21471/m.29506 type:complete len:215 (+) Transcript_21471:57-701(+)
MSCKVPDTTTRYYYYILYIYLFLSLLCGWTGAHIVRYIMYYEEGTAASQPCFKHSKPALLQSCHTIRHRSSLPGKLVGNSNKTGIAKGSVPVFFSAAPPPLHPGPLCYSHHYHSAIPATTGAPCPPHSPRSMGLRAGAAVGAVAAGPSPAAGDVHMQTSHATLHCHFLAYLRNPRPQHDWGGALEHFHHCLLPWLFPSLFSEGCVRMRYRHHYC